MKYCEDAYKLLGKKIICGKNCPIVERCPRIILEDATDEGITKAIEAMFEAIKGDKDEGKNTARN